MLSKARSEIGALIGQVAAARKPALRRAADDDWLLASDLPLLAGAEETKVLKAELEDRGWRTGLSANGWLLLDPLDLIPTSSDIPASARGELGALISLLCRHRGGEPDPRMIRRLAKAAEEGNGALDRLCGALHREFAVCLRQHVQLPDLLPWLCAAADAKEVQP